MNETTTPAAITGYRQLSETEVALINEGKALAQSVGDYIKKLREHADSGARTPAMNLYKNLPAIDQRWVAIGATELQKGFMSVIRGIAQPTTF